jgi:four helix bundle protein
MKMNSKTEELLQRTFLFGVNTLKFLNTLPAITINKVIIYQLAKSATSIGANYEESQAAESKDDFIHKIGIVSKEARESKFWLRILCELLDNENQKKQVEILLAESEQLCKIFTSIKLTSQENKKKK